MKNIRHPILIFAGGTGGHVYPALAVAKKLEQKNIPIIWVGTKKGIESKVVAKAGFRIEWILVSGLRGKGFNTYLIAPIKLTLAALQVIWLLLKHRPCAVLGMGGFVSGPGGLIAALFRRPLIIHEQNAIAGLSNRILASFAKNILTGFPSTFVRKNTECVGNPVREEITHIYREYEIAEPANRPIRILITGGSLGAQVFNKVVPLAVAQIPEQERPEIWHQTGEHKLGYAQEQYKHCDVKARVDAFIESMHEAYGWADLVICRAGAITVAELAIAGVGAILVPYPYAVDDHQTANGSVLEKASAAILIQEKDLNEMVLANLLQDLSLYRSKLKGLAKATHKFAKPNAADDVAKVCLHACLGKTDSRVGLARDF